MSAPEQRTTERDELRDAYVEAQVLGHVILEPATLARIEPRLIDTLAHRHVLAAMRRLAADEQPINTTTLRADLVDRKLLSAAGGDECLSAITSTLLASVESAFARLELMAARREAYDRADELRRAALRGDVEVVPKKNAPSPFDAMRTVGEWSMDVDTTPPDPRWLFTRPDPDVPDLDLEVGVMECGTVAMLPGMPGVGKSTLQLWCALAVATGVDFLGWRTRRTGRALFATAEEALPQVHRRLHRLVHALGLTEAQRQAMNEQLVIWPLRGEAVQLVHGREQNYARTAFCEELVARCAAVDHATVILDPLSRFASPDVETDNHAGTAFVAVLDQLSMLPSAPAVFFTHHIGKGADAEDIYAARGSSSLTGAVKWQANAIAMKNAKGRRWGVRIRVVKSNWAEEAPEVVLRWATGTLRVATTSETREHYASLGKTSTSGRASA